MNYTMAMIHNPSDRLGRESADRESSSGRTPSRPWRILLLTANTGGGHRSSAEATQEALLHSFGDRVEVTVVDLFRSYLPFPLHQIDWIYPRIIRYGEQGWKFSWDLINNPSRSSKFLRFFWPLARKGVIRAIRESRADMIVSFHPAFNYPIQWAKEILVSDVPFITVVTDLLSIHAMWCAPGAAFYMLPTEDASKRCLDFGVPRELIRVSGLPISLRFERELREDKIKVREELGIDANKPVVLLMGGGEGMGRLFKIAKEVEGAGPDLQMLLVAGRREDLREKLERTNWMVPVKIFGFTNEMPRLMRAADVVVTKAGPSTIAEALAMGLPIILSSYIQGQEDGNRTFVEECGAGIYEPDPARIAEIIRDLFLHGSGKMDLMSSSAMKNSRPTAALNVAGAIFSMLEGRNFAAGEQSG